MQQLYYGLFGKAALLSLLGLLAADRVSAQAPAAGTLQPVQSINLSTHSALSGAVQLANHNVVLLLGDTESPAIHAQCLTPDGQSAWHANIERYQRIQLAKYDAWTRQGKEDKAHDNALRLASLQPVDVYTEGNNVVAVERIREEAIKNLKSSSLKPDQVFVQRLDEQGQLTRVLFEPRPEPEAKKTVDRALARYADPDGYVELVREYNKREESLNYVLYHFDLKTKQIRREPITLPATPEDASRFSRFKLWYNDWVYLGRRPNQTYFVRRTLVDAGAKKQSPGDQPITYQVYIVDDHGVATGGFSTRLGLSKGTGPTFSGQIATTGELAHLSKLYTVSNKYGSTTYDAWGMISGGFGSFHLDHDTGDVYIYGDYGAEELPVLERRYDLKGYFACRYSADGKLLQQVQTAYSDAMRKAHKSSFYGTTARQTRFQVDPVTNRTQYTMMNDGYGINSRSGPNSAPEVFELFFDDNLQLQHTNLVPALKKDERPYTEVVYPNGSWVMKPSDTDHEVRRYVQATKADPPVYAALQKLRQAGGAQLDDQQFYLCATGPGTGLIIERRELIGGKLQVYTF